jgi:hypothetical protein
MFAVDFRYWSFIGLITDAFGKTMISFLFVCDEALWLYVNPDTMSYFVLLIALVYSFLNMMWAVSCFHRSLFTYGILFLDWGVGIECRPRCLVFIRRCLLYREINFCGKKSVA